MGGGGSKQTMYSEVVTNIMTNVTSKAMQNCTNITEVEQGINIEGSHGVKISGNTFKQSVKVTISCEQKKEDIIDIQNEITNEIMKNSETSSQAVLSGLNALMGQEDETDIKSFIESNVQTDITLETMQEIINKVNQKQVINITGSTEVEMTNNTFDQAGEIVSSTMNEVFNNTSLVNKIKSQETTSAKTTSENPVAGIIDSVGGAIGNIFGGLFTAAMMPFVFLGAIILIFVIIFKFASSGGDGGGDYYDDDYGQYDRGYGGPSYGGPSYGYGGPGYGPPRGYY